MKNNNINTFMANDTHLYAKKMVATLKYPFSISNDKSTPFALLLKSKKKEMPLDISSLRPDPRDVIKELFENKKGIDVIVLHKKIRINDVKIKIPTYIIFNRNLIIINSRVT